MAVASPCARERPLTETARDEALVPEPAEGHGVPKGLTGARDTSPPGTAVRTRPHAQNVSSQVEDGMLAAGSPQTHSKVIGNVTLRDPAKVDLGKGVVEPDLGPHNMDVLAAHMTEGLLER